MYLKSLNLENYRNLELNNLQFDDKVNLFIGKNGQGKTNLLEAIYFLSLTKSFKTIKLTDIIQFEKKFFFLSADIIKNDYPYIININYDKHKKSIMINNNNESKFKDVIGLLNAVLFVPEDLLLLKGNPHLRRRLFDIELSKIFPKYLFNLSSYYHILKQRNSYLKKDFIDDLVIDTFDMQLAGYGDVISKFRLEFIDEIEVLCNRFYKTISNLSDSIISFKYLTSIYKDNLSFYENLKKSYNRDMLLQQTNAGIHRDDLVIYLNNKPASIYGSQGEQRTIVLSIKLALVEYVYQKIGEYPILLLDDVMSELDLERQENLIKYLNNNVQTFITTTNINSLSSDIVQNSKLFSINNGIVKEANINGNI